MRIFFSLPFLLFILSSCNKSITQEQQQNISVNHKYKSSIFEAYLVELTTVHQKSFEKIYADEYITFCMEHNLIEEHISNKKKYFQLKILHDLFSSSSAKNNSIGSILPIPYMWHWCNPNPRHTIQFMESNTYLVNQKPSQEFGNYKTFADIDRTPYLYLSDLMSENIKYKNETHPEILTFGWCSEREMAFNSILKILGYQAKIFTKDNHCWTETLTHFMDKNNQKVILNTQIDNTFHQFNIKKINLIQQKKWPTDFGNLSMGKWYNKKANDSNEVEKIKKIKLYPKKIDYIESKIEAFIEKNKF